MMKISIIFVFFIFQVFGNERSIPNIQCACQQIINEIECNNWNCQWKITSPVGAAQETGYCDQVSCQSLNQQQCKVEYERCYFQESGSQFGWDCYNFGTCEDIILKQGQTCQESNPKCVQSEITKNKCIDSGFQCQSLSQSQCAGIQDNITLAKEGMCFWNGSSCKVVSQCEELYNESLCTKKWLQNACSWTETKCVSLTCSSFQASNTCRFVQTNPLSGSLIQPCFWNGYACINGTFNQLSLNTCASNTNYHYRWVPIDPQNGICAQCKIQQQDFHNECKCDQLFLQSECNNSSVCKWIDNTCIKLQCSEYTQQEQCAQIHGCYWNAILIPSVCQPYTDCKQILGKNDSSCIQASIYCPGSNGTNCQLQSQLPKCQNLFKTRTMQPNICYNAIGSDGYCTYDIASKSCINIQNCSQLITLQLCNQFNTICIWKIGTAPSQCQQKSCNDYNTYNSCSYIQDSINTNIITICTWNPDTKKCTPFDNSIDYDENQCYNQTGRTYHWSQPISQIQKGLCVPCKFSNILNVKSKCECSDLIYQFDCITSYPNCYWNSTIQTCNIQQCNLLTNQAQCVLNKICYWNIPNNNSSNSSCAQINNSTSSFCSTLNGYTQQECLSQSIICAGITGEGKCQSSLNKCADYKQFYQCFDSLGVDGLCQWNKTLSSCSGINSCNMIKSQSLCNNMVGACYYESNSTSCIQYNCTTLYNQTQRCDYFLSQPNQQYEVKLCNLNGNLCNQTPDLQNLNSLNCYSSSGRTARWNSDNSTKGDCVICYCQLISFLTIILISIL